MRFYFFLQIITIKCKRLFIIRVTIFNSKQCNVKLYIYIFLYIYCSIYSTYVLQRLYKIWFEAAFLSTHTVDGTPNVIATVRYLAAIYLRLSEWTNRPHHPQSRAFIISSSPGKYIRKRLFVSPRLWKQEVDKNCRIYRKGGFFLTVTWDWSK